MKKINILIFTLFALITAAFVLAFDPLFMEGLEPIDDFDWTVNGTSLVFKVNCSPLSHLNVSNISLWTNSTGTWKVNGTNITSGTKGGEVYYEFSTADLSMSDIEASTYTTMIWSFGCYDNLTNVSFSENRTLNYQKSLRLFNIDPASGTYANTQVNTISYNISEQISSDIAYCELWTNRSGNGTQWGFAMSHESNNASGTSFDYTFEDGTSTLWQLICYDGHEKRFRKDSTNYTLHVDASTLTATIVKPSNTYTTNGTELTINVTCTGNYIAGAGLFVNGLLNNTYPDTIVSGEQFIVANLTTTVDGTFNLTVECINSYGTRYNSSEFSLIVDTKAPRFVTLINQTIYDCDSIGWNLSSNEEINTSTAYYNKHGSALTNTNTVTTGMTSLSHILDYGYYTEIRHDVNISITDHAGNKNTTIFNFTSPVGLCSGWNVYTIYNTTMTLGGLEGELVVSDYIYWWNETSQAWIYKTNGTSTNNETLLPKGAVVYIYNGVDFSWYRMNTETDYLHNITNGSNYIPSYKTQTFNKWFNTSLLNSSQGNITITDYEFGFNYIAAWNNTGKKWVNGFVQFGWENDTYVGRWANTSLDAVWILSNNYKVTYDTDNNYISNNWTSSG